MKRILYDMGNSSEYFLTPSWRWEHVVVVSIQVGCQGWGGSHNGEKKFIALFHVSEHSEHFKSILKNWLFSRMGGTPPPFVENSAKIINLIFEPFPNPLACNLECAPQYPMVSVSSLSLTINTKTNTWNSQLSMARMIHKIRIIIWDPVSRESSFTLSTSPLNFHIQSWYWSKSLMNATPFLSLALQSEISYFFSHESKF